MSPAPAPRRCPCPRAYVDLRCAPPGWRRPVDQRRARQDVRAAFLWLPLSHEPRARRRAAVPHAPHSRRPGEPRPRLRGVAAVDAAVQVLLDRQLPQRPRERHLVLLRQPRAERRGVQLRPEPTRADHQLARPGREGLQDAEPVRQALRRLVRVGGRTEGARGVPREARVRSSERHAGGEALCAA